jgi:hypothetical protein
VHRSKRMDHEAELGMVIGRTCKDVNSRQATSGIRGYTCLNDVTVRDLQALVVQIRPGQSPRHFLPPGLGHCPGHGRRRFGHVLSGRREGAPGPQHRRSDLPASGGGFFHQPVI